MIYNAKNQLIKITDTSTGDYYEFKYDYLGRSVEKKSVDPATTFTKFVYHGWNLIAETDEYGNRKNLTIGASTASPLLLRQVALKRYC